MLNIALLVDKRQKVTFWGQIGPLPGILFWEPIWPCKRRFLLGGVSLHIAFPLPKSHCTVHSTHHPPPPSYMDWQRRDEKIWNPFRMAEWTFFDSHLSFFSRKRRVMIAPRHWKLREDCLIGTHLSKLLTLFHFWQRRNDQSSSTFQLVSKLPIKKQGGAIKL